MRRIGVLLNITADDPQSQARLAAFAQGLQQLGWTIGQNVLVDYRWGRGDAEAMRTHAAELVALGPDIILAHSSAALAPLLQVTRTVPIVFTIVADPVGAWVPLLRLRATHYHTVAQERCCASQQKLRADVACGSNSVMPVMSAARPLFPQKRTSIRDLAKGSAVRHHARTNEVIASVTCDAAAKAPGFFYCVLRRDSTRALLSMSRASRCRNTSASA